MLTLTVVMCFFSLSHGQYNTLRIPDTIAGTVFNLNVRDTFHQFLPGNQTITGGINTDFWGPTLFMRKGDTVHMNVHSYLNDSTTMHWHGMHLPAVMDGGPHQIIPPGTVWQPYWLVTNQASTLWYHPHLHMTTEEQIAKGIGGFIIIRDSEEATLPIPRTYGVDDVPLVLTSRRFDASNDFVIGTDPYGDTMIVNGTLHPQFTFPKQFIRLRILNAELERDYNLGFSDNRTFYLIGNDGGLLNAPVALTRLKMVPGERNEILVNLSGDAIGSSLDLRAYNAGMEFGFGGSEPGTTAPFGSLLNNRNFDILHIVVGAATSSAITTLPSSLISNTYYTAADATVSRTLLVTDGNPGGAPFRFDSRSYVESYINYNVGLGATEKWTVINNNVFGHSFHIHDIQFKMISRSSGGLASYEQGWKDTYYLKVNDTVTFVTRFTDYADASHPFMYHCHIAPHEDAGMMGQFVVTDRTAVTDPEVKAPEYNVYPNPAQNLLYAFPKDPTVKAYYATITALNGRTVMMLPRPEMLKGIDISNIAPGTYMLNITDDASRLISRISFIKQ